ncbi:mechanosensitive ion channel protein MscS [Candidatus Peregrinibacteria bacterium CG10_big_fil_rev_8_21_14_0_10_36_19]|nr:MAG: mechanosensitive ion channel protein MscS [Candidatus Peregrinibacteria bacterium CG10_big_fil_rev_8_21_14_0_10_36_19]
MQNFEQILNYQFGTNTVSTYLYALGVFFAILIGFKVFKSVLVGRLKKMASHTKNVFDDELLNIVEEIPGYLYFLVAVYFPLKYLDVGDFVAHWFRVLFVILFFYNLIKIAQNLVAFAMTVHVSKQKDKEADVAAHGLGLIANIVIWVLGIMLALANLGVNINSLIASLGIGGIAVALAVQNILGDMFSSFSIYFDKPFKVGDFIVIGEYMGTVKRIGLKTTRLETLSGEELVLANNDLTNARVQNYKKMRRRRVLMTLAFVYDTSSKKLQKVNKIVEDVVKGVEGVEFARSHFKNFGDFSLNFEVVYYVLSNDYNVYMDKQQEINFAIKDALEKEKIEFAFPTQTLHLQK